MKNKSLKILIVLSGLLIIACGSGGSGGGSSAGIDGLTTSENHSKKSQVSYSDDTAKEPDDATVTGPLKLRRVISMTMDFSNSDGLSDLTRDMTLRYGPGMSVSFKTSQTQECAAGGSISTEAKLFRKTNYQQADEKEEEIRAIRDGDSIFLAQNTFYFVRAHVTVTGLCTAFKSATRVEIHF